MKFKWTKRYLSVKFLTLRISNFEFSRIFYFAVSLKCLKLATLRVKTSSYVVYIGFAKQLVSTKPQFKPRVVGIAIILSLIFFSFNFEPLCDEGALWRSAHCGIYQSSQNISKAMSTVSPTMITVSIILSFNVQHWNRT